MNYIIISCEKLGNSKAEKLNMIISSDVYYNDDFEKVGIKDLIKRYRDTNDRVLFVLSKDKNINHIKECVKEMESERMFYICNFEQGKMLPVN